MAPPVDDDIEQRVQALLSQMTLAEKIGQMCQVNGAEGHIPDALRDDIRAGRVGSVLNEVQADTVRELQRIATQETRLGIPLLFGRDVVHGFRTILPIPIGQAATWNPALVRSGARLAAAEAAHSGVNWTFAPMVDIARDPRWGRIAESLGEDPYLASRLAVAMVEGFQGDGEADSVAACAKHFAGYGASESGKDYNTTNIPENELRNVYLRPFKAAVEAGVCTLMTSFSDLDGVPATANRFLLQDILRDEWRFDGFVVSDWDSVRQLSVHGLTQDDRAAAYEAVTAGLDMEMAGRAYADHLEALIESQTVPLAAIDAKVANILRIKFRRGLFTTPAPLVPVDDEQARTVAKQSALESVVLLKNDGLLPLDAERIRSVAVIGPLADDPYEMLGTWIFDGDPSRSVTCRQAVESLVGDRLDVRFAPGLSTSRSPVDPDAFNAAAEAAAEAEVAIVCLGEESILSGEAHSRANLDLPGAQLELVRRLRQTGTPLVAVILAGRPLTLASILDEVDGLLYAWHPGVMGGPAVADLIFGVSNPSGKLPVSFPRAVGQIPVYYNHKRTGRPPTPESLVFLDDIPVRAPQTSLGMTAFHLDLDPSPQFEFGFGLSYTHFSYANLEVSAAEVTLGGAVTIATDVTNVGSVAGHEVVQLYIRDLVGSTTRPVRELKGFQKIRLEPGQTERVSFTLSTDDLAFYGREQRLTTEPGAFHVWVGGSAAADLHAEFRLVD